MAKLSQAFREKIEEVAGQATFAYRIAVTRLSGDGDAWSADPTIASNLPGCSFGFFTLEEMWADDPLGDDDYAGLERDGPIRTAAQGSRPHRPAAGGSSCPAGSRV